ncbi:hypothetical protein R4I72_05390 [Leclercia adecarboxylata]|uniref:hypothetical protein n=1 Tax=Leclercia adecarboxylata TaxID=83655 RepID=UPI0027BC98D1|nr:hypothetical protein [Leclercia adecarboxylata]MDQ2127882.1 hypothetical protein [Leclercia adecarboxylata]MDV7056495.1 hypothetical protein [Leclercia adecarboxylata]
MSQLKHKNYLQIQIALSTDDFDGFTVKLLRNKLLHQNDEARLYAEDRRAIYRTLIAMVKSGELNKNIASNPQQSTFHKTSLFNPALTMAIKEPEIMSDKKIDQNSPVNFDTCSDRSSIKYLESQLKEYQISLMISVGESEEYKALFANLPGMRCELEMLYMKSREKSSTLMGQITAINNVLSYCKSSDL